MPKAVSRMLTLLCALVAPLPVGTNLGLLHLLWMLVSGRLLAARGRGDSRPGRLRPVATGGAAGVGGAGAGGLDERALAGAVGARWSAARGAGRRRRMVATTRWRWM